VYRDLDRVDRPLHSATIAVTAGRPAGPGEPLNQPPVFASAFGAGAGPGYARRSNPTWEAFEQCLGALEGGSAVAFASGMATAAAAIETLPGGSRVVVGRSVYLEVRELLGERRARGALELCEVDPLDTDEVLDVLEHADALWLDAISNPTLEIAELDLILAAARRRGVFSVIDSTLATPVLLRPLELGADLVIHSATKYIGGHSDLLLGAAVARDPRWADRLRERRTRAGAVPGTMETWLGLRGMRTLPLRIERGAATAATLATELAGHRSVAAVHYPGLAGDRARAVAARLLDRPGPVVAFELGDGERADEVCAAVRVITHASSLGGVETLIERQRRWHADPAIPQGLLRLSVGCEDPGDLWRDLDRALRAAA
jgi:cystathionine gamma-synthase